MIESDPAVSRRVCMETSIDQADRWQGPQSRVTLDRFHRAPGVVALRLLQLIAFGKRESSRVHSYYIHDPSGHQKDRANRVGGEVGLHYCLRVRCCVLRLANWVALWWHF